MSVSPGVLAGFEPVYAGNVAGFGARAIVRLSGYFESDAWACLGAHRSTPSPALQVPETRVE